MAKYKGKSIAIGETTYLLGDQLGSGGSGYVCSAVARDGEDQYAVKFLNVNKDDDNYLVKKERFLKEVEYCKDTNSEHVLKVIECGDFEGKLYYVMPYYPKTLRKTILEETDPFILLNYSIKLCEAIKYIHAQGVIHRDIKPENIFVGKNGELVLGDFGIAHFFDSVLTKSGDWLGNKNYAAPEQLLKGFSNDVTDACDIYALGAVINELFTKQKPSGTKFVAVSDKYPYLYKLDDVVFRCLRQEPLERPSITSILHEIKLLTEEIKSSVSDIQDFLWPIESVEFEDEEIEKITLIASFDILSANYLFREKTEDELERYNLNYNRIICYDVDPTLKNVYFQHFMMRQCEKKFSYEANSYSKGNPYHSLNIEGEKDKEIYREFEKILEKYTVSRKQLDLSGKILKIFSSCCDYHCKELISTARRIEEKVNNLNGSPILYIIALLRTVCNEVAAREILLEDHLSINWNETYIGENDPALIVDDLDDEAKNIFEAFQSEWEITYGKREKKHYVVTFASKKEYVRFKTFALEVSKKDFVFEGDVLEVLRIEREYAGIVELHPLNDFDVKSVLARLLGIKNEY